MRPVLAALLMVSFSIAVQVPSSGTAVASGAAATQPRTFSENRAVVQRICNTVGDAICLSGALALIMVNEFERAEPLALGSCDAGDALGCMLAGIAAAGQGKLDLALDGYGRACDGGVAAACPMLGDMLVLGVRAMEPGWSFDRGWSEGLILYERACEQGDGYGCMRAATLYGGGLGVPRQPDRAARLRRKACEFGNDEACSRRD